MTINPLEIENKKIYQSKRQYQKSLIYFRQALNLVKNQSNFDSLFLLAFALAFFSFLIADGFI